MRPAAALSALVLLPLLASFAPPYLYAPDLKGAETRVAFAPVALDAAAPGRRRIGDLTYLGGWSLRADDHRFGGISALHIADGEAIALTDTGSLLRFPLPPRRGNARILALSDGPGDVFSKRNRDAESLIADGSRLWVAFERHNEVWRYQLADLTPEANGAPAAMRDWPGNSGAEAMARLSHNRTLILSEAVSADGLSEALIFSGDPAEGAAAIRATYRPPKGYRPTDAVQAPDGRILILNRRLSLLDGFSTRIVAARIEEGTAIEGREIAAFASPVVSDNFEALAITQENGRQVLWMASDDNFNPLQRTYLLKFALPRKAASRTGLR